MGGSIRVRSVRFQARGCTGLRGDVTPRALCALGLVCGMMMAVSFSKYGQLHYLDPGAYTPEIGDRVLVPTDAGPEVAQCIWAPQWVSEDIGGLPVCAGMATEEDLARDEENRQRK